MAFVSSAPSLARFLRLAAAAAATLTAVGVLATPAEARHYRHARHHHVYARHHHVYARHHYQAVPQSPAFAAIVVDANSGRTLYSANEDALRHPASITKVMTLYLLFEKLEKGEMTLASRIPVSEHAAAQEPSKLGIAAGDTISVEDAIKAVVTRSANDVAVAIAEAVGGDEDSFAELMTRKAHALGMARTVYRNASGLPNDQQVTCARDLTVLARSLEDRFPRYFRYFSTHEFAYGGEVIGNHNHLLGRIDGVDGIKTGYTRASGFNLLTSVHRDGRSLVAVVMGGRTAAARDRVMENLIGDHIAEAATGRTATMVADASDDEAAPAARPAKPIQLAAARFQPVSIAVATPPAPIRVAAAAPVDQGDSSAEDEGPTLRVSAIAPVKPRIARPPMALAEIEPPLPPADLRSPAALGWAKGPEGKLTNRVADKAEAPQTETAKAEPVKPAGKTVVARLEPPLPVAAPGRAIKTKDNAKTKDDAKAKDEGSTAVARADDAGERRASGWIIQIGATDDPAKANDLLIRARAQNRGVLASARPVTEKVKKGEDTFYRARFAGLDSAAAESACRNLKRSGFSCFAAHD